MRLLYCAFLLIAIRSLPAQIVYQDNPPFADSAEVKRLYAAALLVTDSLKDLRQAAFRLDILEDGEDRYLLPDGRFDVFRWNGLGWANCYKGIHFGYNYGSKKFVRGGKIFSFGGYGYWRHHGQVIEFLPDLGEWEVLPYTSNLDLGTAFVIPEGLHVVAEGLHVENEKDYIIDMIEGRVRRVRKSAFGTVPFDLYNRRSFEFANYYFLAVKPHILVDRNMNTILRADVRPFGIIIDALGDASQLLQIAGDSVARFGRQGVESVTVAHELQYFRPTGRLQRRSPFVKWYLMIALALAGLVGVVLGYRKQRVARLLATQEGQLWNLGIIPSLLGVSGRTLSMEELDEILMISGIRPAESQRFKRAQLIKEINQEYRLKRGRDLIVRNPDPEDRRRYIYSVTEGSN